METLAAQGGVQLEHAFLKVPYEDVNRIFRNTQKHIEKDLTFVLNAINTLDCEKIAPDEASQSLNKLLGRLQGLKRKLEDSREEEEKYMRRLKSRVDHLKDAESSDKTHHQHYNTVRLDRVLVDYLLRQGYYDTAIMIADQAGIQDLVDIDIFISSRKVLTSLQEHNCAEALAWCAENRSRLKKLQSSFEFHLRLQEFFDLVKQHQNMQAIQYARKHLSPWSSTHMNEIQEAMTALAFSKAASPTSARYQRFFDNGRWDDLINQFKHDNYTLHALTLRKRHHMLIRTLSALP